MVVWDTRNTLHFYDRDEGAVVCYCLESGDTHLISAQAAQVLLTLQVEESGSASAEALIARLGPDSGAEIVVTPAELDKLLAELARVGLVVSR